MVKIVCLALALAPFASGRFVLASKDTAASVVIGVDEPRFLRVAANDLVHDVRRIAGKTLSPAVSCSGTCLVLASASVPSSRAVIERLAPAVLKDLTGRVEASRTILAGDVLLIAGSDPHGTMFGLYDFIEHELGVEPHVLLEGSQAGATLELAWDSMDRRLDPPSFRWRGWFINDEDLLTEWKDGGGPRFIDYPYYSQIAAPEVIERVIETAVRSCGSTSSSAHSFVDIDNPDEERLMQQATRRGSRLHASRGAHGGERVRVLQLLARARQEVEILVRRNPKAFEEVWRTTRNDGRSTPV